MTISAASAFCKISLLIQELWSLDPKIYQNFVSFAQQSSDRAEWDIFTVLPHRHKETRIPSQELDDILTYIQSFAKLKPLALRTEAKSSDF